MIPLNRQHSGSIFQTVFRDNLFATRSGKVAGRTNGTGDSGGSFCVVLKSPCMQSALDQAITEAAAAEATYSADVANIATIQTAIDQATSPLAPAQDKQKTDAVAFNAALDALAAAATAAKV